MLTVEQIKTLINGLRQPILSIAKQAVEANKRATEALSQIEQGLPLKMDRENPVGVGSFSMGRKKGTTIGENSFAAGFFTEASGYGSHAEGNGSEATGTYSHSEGNLSRASGHSSHAEGQTSHAEGNCSHAEGSNTQALSYASHAEGYYTKATGQFSHAEGHLTIAEGVASHVEGRSNIPSKEYIHIVGNGDDTGGRRSNAHTLDWKGNAWYQGDVLVGSTSGTNRDAGSVRLAKITEVIPAPVTAEVGQTVRVSAVDENSVPTAWEAVDMAGDGGEKWETIADITTTEEVESVNITVDAEGKPFELLEAQLYVRVVSTPTNTEQTALRIRTNHNTAAQGGTNDSAVRMFRPTSSAPITTEVRFLCQNSAIQGYINNIDNNTSTIGGYFNPSYPTLTAVYLSGGTFGVGSKIKLTGVRA